MNIDRLILTLITGFIFVMPPISILYILYVLRNNPSVGQKKLKRSRSIRRIKDVAWCVYIPFKIFGRYYFLQRLDGYIMLFYTQVVYYKYKSGKIRHTDIRIILKIKLYYGKQ
jgi:hypothetical protein